MNGSVFRSGSGRWGFVVDVPTVTGDRRQVRRRGFRTRAEARDELRRFVGAVALGEFVEPSSLTIGQYIDDHWLPSVEGVLRPTTFDTYRRMARRYIVPMLGTLKLQRLDRRTVA